MNRTRFVAGATMCAGLLTIGSMTGAGLARAGVVATPASDVYAVDFQTALSIPVERGLMVNDDPGLYRPALVTDVDVSGLAGSVTVDPDGSFQFTPSAGFHGGTSFTYRIGDSTGDSVSPNAATVVIVVGDVAARPDTYHLPDRVPSLVVDDPGQGVLANDQSAGLGGAGAAVATAPGHGTVDLAADGTFSYTPTAGFVGVDTFTYTDTGSVNTSTGTVSVTVDPPNADLSVKVTTSSTRPTAGSTITVRLVVNNAGPRPATSVAVGLDVAAGLRITSAPGGLITSRSRSAVWSLTKLPLGRSVTWNVTVQVTAAAPRALPVLAAVDSVDLADLVPGNDRRTVSIRPVAP